MLARDADTLRRTHTFCLSLGLLAACGTMPAPELASPVETAEPSLETHSVPVIRQGRYTLVELQPELAQQHLQWQIIDLRLPATPELTTVGEALRYVLRHSGYHLCDSDPAVMALWALPLPAAHLRLGPLPLHQVLQLLVGTAWRLLVDERERQVCFVVSPLAPAVESEVMP